jgi:hypothetical protein
VAVIWAWLRLDLRRRWKSLAVLLLLVAVSGATVMTALAGARRAASAQERMLAPTLPATAVVLPNQPGFDWAKIQALPEVEAIAPFIVDYTLNIEGVDSGALDFPFVGPDFLHTIEKPIVFSGRNLNSNTADEAVVTRQFVARTHLGVGDTVVVDLPTEQQISQSTTGGTGSKLSGPKVTVHIVGVIESQWLSDGPGPTGAIQLSPGLVAEYPDNTLGDQSDPDNPNFVNALLRLRGGEAAIPKLREDIARVTGRSDIDIWDLPAQDRDAQRHIAFEARCLVAFAIAAFIAALFLVGQAVARYAAASTAELQTLRAIGLAPRQSVAIAAAGPAIVGIAAAGFAAGIAYIASNWMPIGSASFIEPDPGVSWDWVVLGPGLALIPVFVTAGAIAAASLALNASRRALTSRRSAVAAAVARAGVGVPIVIGTRFALEAGRGKTSVPARPALIGSVIGVLGILAAFTFSQGVSDAAKHPERFGVTYQLTQFAGFNGQDFGHVDELTAALRANPDVTGVDRARTAVATGAAGEGSVTLFQYDSGAKAVPVVVTSGRMPEAPDEVALGPTTLTALHAKVGDRVPLAGSKSTSTFLITGSALVPQGPHNGYADGGWLTASGYDSIFTGFKFDIVLVTLRPSARTADAGALLAKQLTAAHPDLTGLTFSPPDPIAEIAELREVRVLPIVLGVFLVLLAIGAVGHALATAVRRRSHDLAVLRAVGMTQWQCRWVVVTQASVLALIGLAFGVPLGLAVGRSVWRWVADYTPLEYVPPMAIWAVALVGPAALIVANSLAAWPGQRAARLHIAQILRTE